MKLPLVLPCVVLPEVDQQTSFHTIGGLLLGRLACTWKGVIVGTDDGTTSYFAGLQTVNVDEN